MEDKIDVRWRTSSYSGNGGGNCVEVAVGGRVLVRDSQDRARTVLQFPEAAWRRFADRVKRSLALDPPWGIPLLCRSVLSPATGAAGTFMLRLPWSFVSANGRSVWGGKNGAWGRAGTGRGFRGGGPGFPECVSGFGPLFLAQVLSVSGTSSPVTGAAERRALRHAVAGDVGDAAHGAGQPPVVELQGPGQVGACPAVGAVPFGGQG